jgi:hypothetical protein
MKKILTSIVSLAALTIAVATQNVEAAQSYIPSVCCSKLSSSCYTSDYACALPSTNDFVISVPITVAEVSQYSAPLMTETYSFNASYYRGTCIWFPNTTVPFYCMWINPPAVAFTQEKDTAGYVMAGNSAYSSWESPLISDCYLPGYDTLPVGQTCNNVGGTPAACCTTPQPMTNEGWGWQSPRSLEPVNGFRMGQ